MTEESGTAGSRSTRLKPAEWTDCKVKWASGQFTLKEIGDTYGISAKGLHRRLTRHGIKRGADAVAYEQEARIKQMEQSSNAVIERDAIVRKKAMAAEEFLLDAVDAIARQGLRSIVEAKKKNLPIATAMDDVKTAKEAVLMFKASVETIKKIVGEQQLDEDELPDLVVSSLTQQDLEDIAREQEEEKEMFGDGSSISDFDELDGE